MKFYITLFCLITSAASKASQVGFTLANSKEMQEKAAQYMFQLIYDQNNDALEKLLRKHPEIVEEKPDVTITFNKRGGYSYFSKDIISAPHFAINSNNHEALRLLLEYGANLNLQRGGDKYTLLMWASHRNNLNCVKILIVAGADKKLRNQNKITALEAFQFGNASLQSNYEAAIREYHQTIADGEAERDRYIVAALEKIQSFITVKDLAAIVCGYAYGVLPRDLPEEKEKKSWLQSHCAIQ